MFLKNVEGGVFVKLWIFESLRLDKVVVEMKFGLEREEDVF